MKREKWEKKSNNWLYLTFAIAIICLFVASVVYLKQEETVWKNRALAHLKSRTEYIVGKVEAWRTERLSETKEIVESPFLNKALNDWVIHKDNSKLGNEIREYLQIILHNDLEYSGIYFTDTHGRVLLSWGNETNSRKPIQVDAVALENHHEVFGDFFKNQKDGKVYLDLSFPIKESNSKINAVLLFLINPEAKFYPILKSWPFDSTSEESFLYRKSGDSILFLSDIKNNKNAACSFKIPLANINNPAVKAVLQGPGAYAGIGYHDQQIFEYILPVKNSPWLLASKIDRDELFAPVHRHIKMTTTLFILIFILVSFFVLIIVSYRRKHYYNQLLEDERQQAALKSHYEYVVKYANDIILLEDEKMNIVDANERAQQAYRYSLQELLNMKITDLVAPELKQQVESRLKNITENDGAMIESIHQRKDGSQFYVEISARMIQVDGRDFLHQIIRDITERKQAEIALIESEERFRTTLHSTGDAIITTDINGKVRYMNPVAEELTGWTEAEASGKPIREVFSIFNEDTREEVENPVDKVLAKGMIVLLSNHTFLKSKNGNEIPIGDSGAPILNADGKITGVVLVFRDQIKERLAKKAIEESELHFHSLATFSPVGIFRTRPDGYTIYVNPRWCQLSGMSSEEALGNGWITAVHPEDRDNLAKEWEQLSQSGKSSISEYRFLQSDGTIVYVLGQAVPEINSENQITGFIGTITDITELRKAEERYRSLFDEDLAGNFVSTIDGELLLCNRAYAEIMGFGSVDEMLKAKTQSFYKNPDDRNEIINLIKVNKKLINYEYPLIRTDGKEIFVVANVLGEFDQTGNLIQLKGYLFDITERNQAEKALHESEETFRNYFENSPLGKSITSIDGTLKVNRAFCRMLGYSKEELLHINWKEITHPDDIQMTENVLKSLIEGEKKIVWFEKRFIHKKGDIIWTEVSTALQKDTEGKPYFFITTIQDITARKQAEKQLKLLGRAVERNPASIVITNTEGIIEYVNPQFTETTGYTQVEVLGKNPNILKSGHQSSGFYRNLWETISTGNIWSGELLNKMKNGELYWENVLISSVENEHGKITHYVAVKEDITERKKMIHDLIIAKEHAQESDRLKSAFLATMSHELRTPLNAVIGFSGLIDEEMPIEQITSFAQMIHNSGNNLLEIVEGIFDLTLLDSGESKPHFEWFPLEPFMETLFNRAKDEQQKANKPQLKIECMNVNSYEPSLFYSDPQRITKIFTYLFRNAFKFTSSGKIEFGYVVVNEGESNSIKFFVKDTGVGILENQKSIIFERFRQADDSYTRKFGGAGIGLTIAKLNVELLGGQIRVDSEPGKGSAFYFTIPINEPEQLIKTMPDQTVSNRKQKTFSNQTVLIAENEESNYKYLSILLLRLNLKILHARDGLEAVNLCSVHPETSLVLMDINMPNMNGIEAIKIIKQVNPKLPVIAVTAFAMSGDREKFIEEGCDGYLEKPIKQDKLLTLLCSFMS